MTWLSAGHKTKGITEMMRMTVDRDSAHTIHHPISLLIKMLTMRINSNLSKQGLRKAEGSRHFRDKATAWVENDCEYCNFKLSALCISMQVWIKRIAVGAWRNGSASDSRSEGWVFESLRPHTFLIFFANCPIIYNNPNYYCPLPVSNFSLSFF